MNLFKTCLLIGFLLITIECAPRYLVYNPTTTPTPVIPIQSSSQQDSQELNKIKSKVVNNTKFNRTKKLHSKRKVRKLKEQGEQLKPIPFEACEQQVKKCYDLSLKETSSQGLAKDILLLDCADIYKCQPFKIRICIRKEILKIPIVTERCQKWDL